MGKRPRLGDRLPIEIRDEEHLLEIVDKTINWYGEHGEKGERFGDTLDRLGVDLLAESL
jgi:dissimilatory sulfite reductase (desulfoviridin) alpha/beta subunit